MLLLLVASLCVGCFGHWPGQVVPIWEREVELLVLRHQLKVLSRGDRRPPFRRWDRILLAAACRILPRDRWNAVGRLGVALHRHLVQSWVARPASRKVSCQPRHLRISLADR